MGEVWGGEGAVEAVLGTPAGVAVLVVEGNPSTVITIVVTVSVEVVLGALAQSVTTETSADVVELPVGGTMDDRVVSTVSLVGDRLADVGSSTVLMVHLALGDLSCVVVKTESVGLVEEVNQNSDVMAKGALLVLDVVGPEVLTAELTVLVVPVVAPIVDSGSRTSGLMVGVVVGRDGGAAVLGRLGASDGVMVGGRVGSSGEGEASVEDICVLVVAAELVNMEAGEVGDGGGVLMGLVVGPDVAVAFVTGEGGVTGGTITGALIPGTMT